LKAQKEGLRECEALAWARLCARRRARRPGAERFDDHRGCGFLGLADCYGCLRAGKDLANTADNVASRPAPSFD